MPWSFSVFSGRRVAERRYETCLILLFKEKRRTADGKRNPETEEINITCDGIEPNLNSAPGHARRACYPVLGDGMRLGACWGGFWDILWNGSTPIYLLLTIGQHQHCFFRPLFGRRKNSSRFLLGRIFVSNLNNSIFKSVLTKLLKQIVRLCHSE